MQDLRNKNPEIPLYSVMDEAFAPYGRVITDMDAGEVIAEARKIPMPAEGSAYTPSIEAFEKLAITQQAKNRLFGALPTQMGYCYGSNSVLGALEWHIGSELNIAVTPFVLFLALQADLKERTLDSSKIKAFYVPQGAVVEIYEGTLHFCPCQVQEGGFGCVVGLLEGTNIPLEQATEDKVLFKKNKFLIAHNENQALIERGVAPGITGKNLKLNY